MLSEDRWKMDRIDSSQVLENIQSLIVHAWTGTTKKLSNYLLACEMN